MTFIRTIEDFVCENCSREVKGNGYTNHCSFCLWSKHVDVNPGDRASDCGGLMRPVEVFTTAGQYNVIHRCRTCGYMKKNKISREDNFGKLIDIAKNYERIS